VYYDEKLGMYRQRTNEGLNELLEKIYEEGTLVEGSLSNQSGKIYLDKLVDYIATNAGIEGKNIFEIGCGNGALLAELRKKGAAVLGLEPGLHSRSSDAADIRIIRDFFPSPQVTGIFDAIIHYGVMEHVPEPGDFLRSQGEFLAPDGSIIISVPNCEPFLGTGDISIFIHEHLNYFTPSSVVKTIESAGLRVHDITVFEGVVLATVKKIEAAQHFSAEPLPNDVFEEKIDALNAKVKEVFSLYEESEVAVYVPFRAMNALFLAGIRDCRLVDDNPQVLGKYLPWFRKPVESFDGLLANPPRYLLIYSRTFGQRIKEKCLREAALKSTKIAVLNDFD
jgi:SAM-dependent methyltransferase